MVLVELAGLLTEKEASSEQTPENPTIKLIDGSLLLPFSILIVDKRVGLNRKIIYA